MQKINYNLLLSCSIKRMLQRIERPRNEASNESNIVRII